MMTAVLASGLVAESVLGAQDDMSRVLDELARLRAQNERIVAENAALSDKVTRLEQHASEKGVWLTDERAREIRAVVTDVLADSAARANLAGDAATAG